MKKDLIIVTATIAPKDDVFSLALKDKEERLRQYRGGDFHY